MRGTASSIRQRGFLVVVCWRGLPRAFSPGHVGIIQNQSSSKQQTPRTKTRLPSLPLVRTRASWRVGPQRQPANQPSWPKGHPGSGHSPPPSNCVILHDLGTAAIHALANAKSNALARPSTKTQRVWSGQTCAEGSRQRNRTRRPASRCRMCLLSPSFDRRSEISTTIFLSWHRLWCRRGGVTP